MEIQQHASKQPIVKQEIKRKFKSTFRPIKKRTYEKLWDAVKVALREKFIEIQVLINPPENSLITNLILHGKEVGKKQTNKVQISRYKEITKWNAEINPMETKKTKDQWKYNLTFLERYTKLTNF